MYTLCDMKNIDIKYFSKNVHILARSDFIKLKMKFHSFSHGIPRESSGLSGRDMRKIDPSDYCFIFWSDPKRPGSWNRLVRESPVQI